MDSATPPSITPTLRCWPGCLAVIVKNSRIQDCAGMLVEVIHAAPLENFRLPNGVAHSPAPRAGFWVIKTQGRPFVAPLLYWDHAELIGNIYAVAPDSALRPIGSPPGTELALTDVDQLLPIPAADRLAA